MKWTKPPSADPSQPTAGQADPTEEQIGNRPEVSPAKKKESKEAEPAGATNPSAGQGGTESTTKRQSDEQKSEALPLGLAIAESARGEVGKDQPEAATAAIGPGPWAGTPIPAILLEGDDPTPAPRAGPIQKFAFSSEGQGAAAERGAGELPEAYGTGRLLLTARDPRCVYAHWDLTTEQQRHYADLAADGQLVLRVHRESLGGPLVAELRPHPESRSAFLNLNSPVGRLVADLGYYLPGGPWTTIAVSNTAAAPIEPIANEEPVRFATLKFTSSPSVKTELPISTTAAAAMTEAVTAPAENPDAVPPARMTPVTDWNPPKTPHFAADSLNLPEAPSGISYEGSLEERAMIGAPGIPPLTPVPTPGWSAAQGRALAELIDWRSISHEWLGSAEIEDLIQAKVRAPAGSVPSAISSLETALLPAGISSGAMAEGRTTEHRGFWLNVNAELVIYGSSDPNAKLSLAGQTIRLRPDGTFSYRFALPDGSYQLPVIAVSPDGDVRQAELDFYRGSLYSGEVGSHPQDPVLKAPLADNVS